MAVRLDYCIKTQAFSLQKPVRSNKPLCRLLELFNRLAFSRKQFWVFKKPHICYAKPPGLRGTTGLSGKLKPPTLTAGLSRFIFFCITSADWNLSPNNCCQY